MAQNKLENKLSINPLVWPVNKIKWKKCKENEKEVKVLWGNENNTDGKMFTWTNV